MKRIETVFSCSVISMLGDREIEHDHKEKVIFEFEDDTPESEIEKKIEHAYCVWALLNDGNINIFEDYKHVDHFAILREVRLEKLMNSIEFRDELPNQSKPDFIKNDNRNIVGAQGFEMELFPIESPKIAICKQYSRAWSNFEYIIENVYALPGTDPEYIREFLAKKISTYEILPEANGLLK